MPLMAGLRLTVAGTAEEAAEPGNGFEPLQADSLRRVVGSDDSGQGDTR